MFLFAWLALQITPRAHAETADEIVAAARAHNRVDSAIQEIQLAVIKNGAERLRTVRLSSRQQDGGSKTLLEVVSPSDLAGFRVLRIDHATGADETMFYTPYNKRINYVDSNNQRTRFIDSDLTMEDLQLREHADGAHTLVEETPEKWVIDTVMGQGSSYTKVRATIARSTLVLMKLELYSGEKLAKTIEVLRTESAGTVTLPTETLVRDLQRGTQTKLTITSHRIGLTEQELPANTFSRDRLAR